MRGQQPISSTFATASVYTMLTASGFMRVMCTSSTRRGGHELLPQVIVAHEVGRPARRLQQVQLEVVKAVRPAAAEALGG